MLTELYVAEEPKLAGVAHVLRELAPTFGEGLQLVNILKDSATDREHGRAYIPSSLERGEVIALARRDMDSATKYVRTLERAGASRGILAFDAFPLLLARATLDALSARGAGAKVDRAEVLRIVSSVNDALDRGAPLPL
jgi:farnesyl-diphosphate farnesyltransferase